MCICALHVCWCPERPEEGIRHPENGVIDSCEPIIYIYKGMNMLSKNSLENVMQEKQKTPPQVEPTINVLKNGVQG